MIPAQSSNRIKPIHPFIKNITPITINYHESTEKTNTKAKTSLFSFVLHSLGKLWRYKLKEKILNNIPFFPNTKKIKNKNISKIFEVMKFVKIMKDQTLYNKFKKLSPLQFSAINDNSIILDIKKLSRTEIRKNELKGPTQVDNNLKKTHNFHRKT